MVAGNRTIGVAKHNNPTLLKVTWEPPQKDGKKEKTSYSRAQYGITMQITPTINLGEEDEELGYITLDTDITFRKRLLQDIGYKR